MRELSEHERAFVNAFVVKDKRTRYLQLLANPKRRRKLLDRLNHASNFDPTFMTTLTRGHFAVTEISALLREKGAEAVCHILADNSEYDGLELPLEEAVRYAVKEDFAVILSCIPGQLAYFKMEYADHAYILERPSKARGSSKEGDW